MMRIRCSDLIRTAALIVLLLGATAGPAHGQVRWRDLVVTLGSSLEAYSGNFSAVSVPIVDSTDTGVTEHVVAGVGELGVRGALSLLNGRERTLDLSFDGGLRQAAAFGFYRMDYAPREWVGSATGNYTQMMGGWGSLLLQGQIRGRSVQNRPPMPLFMQPGYLSGQGMIGVVSRSMDGVSLDAHVDAESADYTAAGYLPQVDLLDRRSVGLEAGVRWGGASTLRFSGGYRWTHYRNQGSFDEEDPFRRDHTARVGLEWSYSGALFAQVGVDGTLNRSNSNRPEYDAFSVRALLTAPLPNRMSLNLYALLTAKSYVQDSDFALLVPGEEADNASLAYLQVGRPLAANLDGAFRLGWTRAETDFGDSYYRRIGASVQLNYRPRGF